MPSANKPNNERDRIDALKNYSILDTLPEKIYDDIVSLVSMICETPIALISLVDEERQWFKASKGIDMNETSRDLSFCAHAILTPEKPLIVEDATKDIRFIDNRLVTGDPHIRFYAGFPLNMPSGHSLGTICAIDTKPRTLTKEQELALKKLADTVTHLLQLSKEQHEEKKIKKAMQLAVEGGGYITPQGCYSYVNHAYVNDIGYTVDELLGQPWEVTIIEDERDKMRGAYQTMLQDGKVIAETIGLRKDGSHFHKQVTMISDYNDKGEFIGSFCFMQNITERKKAEEKIQELIQFNQTIFDTAPVLMGIMDKNFNFQSMNAYAQKVLGYDAEDFVGVTTPYILHKPEELEQRAQELSEELGQTVQPDEVLLIKMKQGKFEAREWTYIRKDGTSFPVILSFVPLIGSHGEMLGILGVALDITNLKDAEIQIKDAKNFQDLVLNSNPDYVFVKDKDFKIVQANPAFISLYPPEKHDKIIGHTTFEAYNADEVAEFLKYDHMAFDTGQSETYETIEFPNGEVHTLLTKKVRFENAKNEPFIFCIARDVTEQLALIRKLERSNEALDDFAYIASHDLKEPLRGMHNHANFLLRDYGDKLDQGGVRKIERITVLTQRMEILVNNLLYYSRLGRTELAVVETDLNEVIDGIKEMLLAARDENIIIEIPKKLPNIVCNREKIEEVFRNLISNAIKYNNSPTKHIEIGRHSKRKGEIVFYVKDNGIGIEKKFHDDIFKIFKRLHKRDAYGGGTGSGLTFVKKIISGYGGDIWLDSENKNGTTFYFTLPEGGHK